MSRKTLLSLNFFPNFLPPRTGGEQRSFFLLKALADRFDIISVVPTYENMRMEEVTLAPGLKEVRIPKSGRFSAVSAELRKKDIPIHQTAMAYALAGASQPDLLEYLRGLWPAIDGVILQHATAAAVADAVNLERKPTFYLSHNCEFELAANAHIGSDDHEYALLMHQLEYRACMGSEVVVPTTTEDREKFVHLYGVPREKVHVAGNGSLCRYESEAALEVPVDPASAIFLGSKWGPNLTAGRFICSDLAPTCPGITFHLCGNVCDDLGGESVPRNVVLHGVLRDEDLAERMARTHIGLNPILDGAGSNVKLADYLAHGLRVVTTPKGMRGFWADLENLHCAAPSDLAGLLNALCREVPDAATRRTWRARAEALWSWERIGADLGARMELGLAGTAPEAPPARRIVVMNEFPVTGRETGGEARIAGLLSEAPDDTEVAIVSFGRGNFAIHDIGPRVSCIELPATTWQQGEVAQANRYNYTSVDDVVYPQTVHRNPMFLGALERMVAHADAVVMEHPFMWEVYRQIRSRAPLIYGSHNVEADMKQVTLDSHKRKQHFCDIIRGWEQQLVRQAELVCACSPQDAEVYRSWGAQRVEVLENGVTPLEVQSAEGGFEAERNIYLRSEFADLAPDEAGVIFERLLKRAPTVGECQAGVQALTAGGATLDRFLLGLVRSPENINGPRCYVTGLLISEAERPFSLVFMGTAHRPNLSAAELLISHVAPACPDCDFLIVGKVGRSLGNTPLPPNVFVTGFVSDNLKTAVMLDCDVGLNPMTEGGGSNLKIPDYLVHGLEVVSTFFGGRGFRFSPEEGLHLAEILSFPEKLKELNAAKGHRRPPRRVAGARIEEYYWSVLSRRYYELIAEAAEFDRPRDTVVLRSEASLDETVLSQEAAPLARQTGIRVIAQGCPQLPSPEAPRYHDLGQSRLSLFEHRRELYVALASLPSYGMFRRRLMPQRGNFPRDASLPMLPREEIDLQKGFSAPLYNGRRVHRFLSDGAQIRLPANCQTAFVSGYALEPVTVKIHSNSSLVLQERINKKYSLTIPIDGGELMDISISGAAAGTQYPLSMESFSILCGGVSHRMQLLQPGFGPDHMILDGIPQAQPLQENGLLDTAALWARHEARRSESVLACGNRAFGEALARHLPGSRPYTDRGPAVADWAIGMMSNKRNRTGYRNKLNLGASPLVILTDDLTSELLVLTEYCLERLKGRFPYTKAIVFVPRGIDHTRAAWEFREYFEKKSLPVTCQRPESERETLAVAAEAGTVLGYRLPRPQQERMALLADVFDLSLCLWGGERDISRHPRAVGSIEEVIHRFWQRASRDDWVPASRFDLLDPENRAAGTPRRQAALAETRP